MKFTIDFEKIKKFDFSMFIYKKLKFGTDRYHLFTYISQGLRNGGTTKELFQSILIEYQKSKNEYMTEMIEETLYHMEELGATDAEAMQRAGLITTMELRSVEHISKSEPHKAMNFLNNKSKNENNMKWAVGMLFFPTILVLLGYVIFQPELKAMTEQLLEPVNSLSKTPIEGPEYFNDRTVFAGFLTLTIVIMASFFGFLSYLQKNNIRLLFKLFKIKEREFVLNNFEIFLSLLKSGQSPMRAVELLSDQNNDYISRKIFGDIKNGLQEGDKYMHEVLSEYGLDSATVSYMRSGEENNFLIESIQSIVDYNEERYEKLVKKLTKILPLIGEIIMTVVILLPLIDIINVTTVGTMSFEV
jgi:type II secretory pathway component PulF